MEPSKINIKGSVSRRIIFKLQKTKGKENQEKLGERFLLPGEMRIRFTVGFMSESARRKSGATDHVVRRHVPT